jgi:hypothetical protein
MSTPEDKLLEVAWYFSKFGKEHPPSALGVEKWKDAFALFYPRFGEGKTPEEFYNSLKNHRDRFDSWLSNTRRGWRNKDGTPRNLPIASKTTMQRMNTLPSSTIEKIILSYLSTNTFEKLQQDLIPIIQDKKLDDTTRERLISARLGQGYFRKECLKLYPACPLTNITFEPLLRASHIKPWSACQTGAERLDPFNGLILAAHVDVLFDQGWLSFANDGKVLLSDYIDQSLIKKLQLPEKIKPFHIKSVEYLKWHRDKILRAQHKLQKKG